MLGRMPLVGMETDGGLVLLDEDEESLLLPLLGIVRKLDVLAGVEDDSETPEGRMPDGMESEELDSGENVGIG